LKNLVKLTLKRSNLDTLLSSQKYVIDKAGISFTHQKETQKNFQKFLQFQNAIYITNYYLFMLFEKGSYIKHSMVFLMGSMFRFQKKPREC